MTPTTNKTTAYYVKFISVHGLNALKHYAKTLDKEDAETAERAIHIYKNNLIEKAKKDAVKEESKIDINEWFIGLAPTASERLFFAEYLAQKLCVPIDFFFWLLSNPGKIENNHRLILQK